ncbi:MAG: MBOAT family protein [Lachnospiraceae bacterium]|nr:MBOAT family protein [Lachnospiraceae bacterium]
MVFNSYVFVLVFVPLVVVLYHLFNSRGAYSAAKIFLLAASLFFYACDDPRALLILLASILVNYGILILIGRASSLNIRRLLLGAGVILNISLLIYFKYLGFFSDVINSLFHTELSVKSLLLPLGISYYTFSQITCLVDRYRDPSIKTSLLDQALYVTFFPKITVGPIAPASDLIPQFNDPSRKKLNPDNIAGGLVIFACGLAKKVLLADNLAPYVTWGYSNLDVLGPINALIVMLAYTMQVYFDFSGYCDMAKAVCLMINIDLPDNFLSPYTAVSVADFWKKWHITLTGFFTKYVYIPLGGNRKGKVRTYVNMFIIFFLSGLWHGASYTFIVWGLIHGMGISLNKLLKNKTEKIPRIIRQAGTFIFINITWVFFRASSLTEAVNFFKQFVNFKVLAVHIELVAKATPDEMQLIQWLILNSKNEAPYISGCIIIIGFLLLCTFISMYCKNSVERLKTLKLKGLTVATTVILLVTSILSLSGVTEFIYENF